MVSRPSKRNGGLVGRGKRGKSRGSVDSAGQPAARGTSSALSLAEIDQVLIQNLDTELGLIEECCADLARPSRIFSLHG